MTNFTPAKQSLIKCRHGKYDTAIIILYKLHVKMLDFGDNSNL